MDNIRVLTEMINPLKAPSSPIIFLLSEVLDLFPTSPPDPSHAVMVRGTAETA